jgi:hypothetical protein
VPSRLDSSICIVGKGYCSVLWTGIGRMSRAGRIWSLNRLLRSGNASKRMSSISQSCAASISWTSQTKDIVGVEINDRLTAILWWFEIKRKASEVDVKKRNERGCRTIVEMILGCFPLLANPKSDIQIIPDNHESTRAHQSDDLAEPFLPECLDVANSCYVREGKSSIIENIKLGSGCATCEYINAHRSLKLAQLSVASLLKHTYDGNENLNKLWLL